MVNLVFVQLININENYEKHNLYLGAKGLVFEKGDTISKVLFLNEYNEGDYAFVEVSNIDLGPTNDPFLIRLLKLAKETLQDTAPKEKGFKPRIFRAYQDVELLIEDEEYTKFDIHKGDIGSIMEDVAVQDNILVNFGKFDENKNYSGHCVMVNLKNVKILK